MMATATRPVYGQCGLRLRSEVPLDLPVVFGSSWDVDVVQGPDMCGSAEDPPGRLIAERLSPLGTGWWYRATETHDGYLLRFSGSGDVVISPNLARVEVRPERGRHEDLLPVLLAGTVCAFLLALRGQTVLHASAVSVDGVGLAFAGPSGWGKTTLATLLCLAGASMVADDVATVEPGPPATCRGGATELRLRTVASGLAAARPDLPSRRTVDDRLALQAAPAITEPVPLAAVVFPAPSRETNALRVRRLPPPVALMRLLGLMRVEGWSHSEVLCRDFERLSGLVNHVPAYTAVVPWGPPFAPAVADELAALTADGALALR